MSTAIYLDETRAIVVRPCKKWPDGYIPVVSCGGCQIRLFDSSFCKAQIMSVDSDMAEINKDCPLPPLSQVEKHSPDEMPKNENGKISNRLILMKLKNGKLRLLQYNEEFEIWEGIAPGIIYTVEIEDCESWQELPK